MNTFQRRKTEVFVVVVETMQHSWISSVTSACQIQMLLRPPESHCPQVPARVTSPPAFPGHLSEQHPTILSILQGH